MDWGGHRSIDIPPRTLPVSGSLPARTHRSSRLTHTSIAACSLPYASPPVAVHPPWDARLPMLALLTRAHCAFRTLLFRVAACQRAHVLRSGCRAGQARSPLCYYFAILGMLRLTGRRRAALHTVLT